ncbi:MAG: biopolymer transporter ExbD [Chthoniobacteraceae bacterium]|nr:biopolymer transporter ExbD [Chthoniobacteraceae bacterium]MDB6174263.1 biopolymer transporter ExbD [Chthoniobacteraceae bacterium]
MSHHVKSSRKKRAETRLPPEEDPEFQIAPMIDILLVLLVFFMSISSTEVLQTNDQVHLPVAKDSKEKSPQVAGEGQLMVNVLWTTINNSGTIDIDGKTYPTADDLTPVLVAKLAATPKFRMLIRADREVRYEFLRTILKAAGTAGVTNVTFSVVDKESVSSDAPATL